MNRFQKTLRGIHLRHLKHSADIDTVDSLAPKEVVISMQQHIGAPCEVQVKVGDNVKVGQVLGDSGSFVSAPIHASVSGKVTAINDLMLSNATVKGITIESDGKQEVFEGVKKPDISDAKSFFDAIRASGIVGLGGAGFPTHVKLNYKDLKSVHTLVINAAECEPYITSDYRECMEGTEDIIFGISQVLKYTGIPKAVIVTETNKPLACEKLEKVIKDKRHDDKISVLSLQAIYPKGAEKVAIFEATGVTVGDGKLPAQEGVIVLNVTTTANIARYINTGMPLTMKRVTVDGDIVPTATNVFVPIGTRVQDILEYANVPKERLNMVIMGGVMMGVCLPSCELPIMKQTNAILFFEKVYDKDKSNCIRCSKCIMVCPLKLMPQMLEKAYDSKDAEELKKYDVNVCMNCGCCSYICPAKRDLSHKIQLAKTFLRESTS